MDRNQVPKVASTHKNTTFLAVNRVISQWGCGQLEFEHGLLFNRDYGDLLVGLDEAGRVLEVFNNFMIHHIVDDIDLVITDDFEGAGKIEAGPALDCDFLAHPTHS